MSDEPDAPQVRVSVVIPSYEEEASLPQLIPRLDRAVAALAARDRAAEVIVVDDGSSDRSFEVLDEAAAERPWLRAVRLRRNYGQTAALSAGFDRARGEIVVALDADGQNDPDDIPALIDKLDEGYDVVSGWRKDRKDTFLTRRIPSRLANWLIGRVSGLRLHDYGCTLKAYRREYLEGVQLYGEMHRFLPIYARWEGARIAEIQVRHHPREGGASKYGLSRTVKVLLDLLTVKFLGDYSTKPLYMFGKPGLLLCLLGCATAAVTLVQKWTIGAWVHRNPLALLAVMLFIVGVQLIGMGLIAELLVRTYHESQGKPTYKVREEILPRDECAESAESSPARRVASISKRSAR